MIGARDMAFPRLNALSFWLFVAGGVVFYGSIFWSPPECGWTCYAPLSEKRVLARPAASTRGSSWSTCIGVGSFLGAINFFVTIAQHARARHGLGPPAAVLLGDPDATSILLILALPVIAGARHDAADRPPLRHALLRRRRTAARRSSGSTCSGSSGTPRSTSWSCPGFGDHLRDPARSSPASRSSATRRSRRRRVGIAFLGSLVWAHHMFTTPLPVLRARLLHARARSSIAIPTGVKIFNWIATLWRGTIEFTTPLLLRASASSRRSSSAASPASSSPIFPVDWQLHDTYFVVAHFHYMLVGGAVFAIFAGHLLLVPEDDRPDAQRALGKASFWLMLVGFNVTFLIQHSVGPRGHAAAHLRVRRTSATSSSTT